MRWFDVIKRSPQRRDGSSRATRPLRHAGGSMPQRKDVELLLTGYVEGSRKSRSISTLSGKLSELETLAYDQNYRCQSAEHSARVPIRPMSGRRFPFTHEEEVMTRIGPSLILAGLLAGATATFPAATSVAQGLPPACGTVTADTRLVADCLAPLTVQADDVTVDLGGHQVLCVSPGTGVEVSDHWDVRIQNGQVNNCSISVRLHGGGGHTLSRLQISTGPGGGILIENSDDNLVRYVRVVGVRGFGIEVSGTDNRLRANELASIVSQGGTAIRLREGASETQVLHNLVHNNAVGIQVGGSGNLVQGNQADHNQIGINVDGSENIVRANLALDNALGGITVGAAGVGNLLQANRARANGIYDLADFPRDSCTLNTWKANSGERLLD